MTGALRGLRVGVVILLIAATSLAPGSSLAGGLQPEDVQIVSLVSSWCLNCGFPDARTTSANEVFAIGDVGPPWGSCTFKCSVLLHSPDAGRTWEQLAGGLNASQVMLDHRWDNFGDMSAHRVYVVTPNGLEVSTDAGLTFHRILSTAIANRAWRSIVNPGSETGNGPAILMEATQLGRFGYEDFPVDQGTTSPLVFLGSSAHPQSFTFDPSDGTHLWATSSPAPTSASGSGGFSIRLDDCRYVINETYSCTSKTLTNPDLDARPITYMNGTSHSHPSRDFYHDKTLIVYGLGNRGGAFLSTDGGQTFEPLDFGGYSVFSMDNDGGGTYYAGVYDMSRTLTPAAGMMKSSDGGRTWSLLGSNAPPGAENITVLPNGNVIATSRYTYRGLMCSSDGGATWAPRCP